MISNLLFGMALGDGCITKNSLNSYSLCIKHCKKQEHYALFKLHKLETLICKEINLHHHNYGGYPSVTYSVTHPDFKNVYDVLYIGGKKKITEALLQQLDIEAISIWYMDDGSLTRKKRNGKIHAYDLSIATYCSEEEVNIVINFFIEKWDIFFTKKYNKGRYSIRCGTKEARKFITMIKPFICDSMLYKLDIRVGTYEAQT
jgi:hypothetical protein